MADDKKEQEVSNNNLGFPNDTWDGYSKETKLWIENQRLNYNNLSSESLSNIQAGRLKEAEGVIARNQEKKDLQRDINFAKNDTYNAGMAANTLNKLGTLNRNQRANEGDLRGFREPTAVPNVIRNQALQNALSNSQYAQARGLGADVIGNQNTQNNQAYLNALDVTKQSSNQGGNLQSQNQALFNKMLMSGKGGANMQMQYQQMANQDLARNIAQTQAEDAAQNNFNMANFQTMEALRARDIARNENRRDSFRNATQETLDTVPYLASKQTGDYTHMREQRDLPPREQSSFMQKDLFNRQKKDRLQGRNNEVAQISNNSGIAQTYNNNRSVPLYNNNIVAQPYNNGNYPQYNTPIGIQDNYYRGGTGELDERFRY